MEAKTTERYGTFKAWAVINGKQYRADVINGMWRLSVEIVPSKRWDFVDDVEYLSAREAFASISA